MVPAELTPTPTGAQPASSRAFSHKRIPSSQTRASTSAPPRSACVGMLTRSVTRGASPSLSYTAMQPAIFVPPMSSATTEKGDGAADATSPPCMAAEDDAVVILRFPSSN